MRAARARNTTLWGCLALGLVACESPADKGTVEVRKEEVQPREPSAAAPSTSSLATAAATQAKSTTATPAPSEATAPAKLELRADVKSANATAAPAPGSTPPTASAQAELVAAAARQGNVVSDAAFSTWLEGSSPVPSGPAQLQAVLVAKPPYHVNAEYPHKFTFSDPPAGLEYPEKTVRGMQVTPERGALRLPVVAKSAGPSTVSGTLSFSVCTDERCLVEKRELQVALDVK
jgi:hypothetical protein